MRKVILTVKEDRKYTIIKETIEGKRSKTSAEVVLCLTRRQINRLIALYHAEGKNGFSHKSHQSKPVNATPDEIKNEVVTLYQQKYDGANFTHFTELLAERESIHLSRSTVANILAHADIISPKARRATKREHAKKMKEKLHKKENTVANEICVSHQLKKEESHPSRPRKKYFGELIQLDASEHLWFGDNKHHLHAAIDDATGRIVAAYFDHQETLNGYYHVYHQILRTYGIPFEFFTDRRTVFEYEQKKNKKVEKDTFTQFSYACHQLGTKISTSSIPQAKGRVERLFNTLQSRLIIELRIHKITTIEEANHFLIGYLKKFNAQFATEINHNTSVMVESPSDAELNIMLGILATRKINNGHHFSFQNNLYLPMTASGKEVYFQRGTEVLVIRAFDGELFASVEDTLYQVRKLADNEAVSKEFDTAEEKAEPRKKYIPPMSHPWRAASFNAYLKKQGITQEEFNKRRSA